MVRIVVDGKEFEIPETLTIQRALQECGYNLSKFPGEGDLQAPCKVGGCYSCLVRANGAPVRACITTLEPGMVIETDVTDTEPLRIIHGPSPHTVGGKATPWWLKAPGFGYIEVAIWTAGCNLCCPQCQNYDVTYDKESTPLTPKEAAQVVTAARKRYRVNRMAISGGEPTLNKRWLLDYFQQLKALNPDEKARPHLDSNGTLLTKDYIDQLMEAGITDIGIEPKGVRVDTFMEIAAIKDMELAQRYLNNSWNAIEYIIDQYKNKVFLGIGLPYNHAFMTMDEVRAFGERVAKLDNEVQVCVLDYFPAFKRQNITRPTPEEMFEVKGTLEATGLETVVIQTSLGHFGPGEELPKTKE